jgi:hypothetical protein
MRYRLLFLLVFGAALAHLLATALAPSPGALASIHFGFRVAWRTAATAACFWAALAFSRGDYLRRAWLLLGATLLLLLVKDVWRGPSLHGLVAPDAAPAEAFDRVRDVLVVVANVIGLLSTWVMARTWYRAGLGLGVSRGRQAMAFGVALLAALLAAGSTLSTDVAALLGGHAEATALVASDAADVLTFVLFAPLVLTAFALRGGLLGWTWGFLALGNLAWLVMDVAQSLGAFGQATPGARLGEELARTVAAACYVAAGLAQRWLLDEVPRRETRRSAEAPR